MWYKFIFTSKNATRKRLKRHGWRDLMVVYQELAERDELRWLQGNGGTIKIRTDKETTKTKAQAVC